MNSSTSSSSARFLALLAAGVIGVEVAFALAPPHLGRHEVDDRAHAAESAARPARAVLLGDSVSYGVVDPGDLPDDALDLSSNQSIGLAGNTLLVRRLADAQGFPRFVVLALNPISLASDLDSERFLEPYFTSVFTREREIAEVADALARPELARAQRAAARKRAVTPPSHLRRGYLHEPLRAALRRVHLALAGDGGPGAVTAAARREIAERGAEPFRTSAVTDAFLPRLAAACAEHGATLVLLQAPVPPSLEEAWERSGFRAAYDAWQRGADDLPGVVAPIGCPLAGLSDADFYDGVHLAPRAKRAWGATLAAVLADPEGFRARAR